MLWVIIFIIVLCFGGVVFVGAPYLPTLQPQVETALELLNLKPGETLLELGCGDGKVLIAAAQTGLHAVGYEINPFLALIAWARTRRFRKQVRVVWGDIWLTQWPPADGIFVFLHGKFMRRLDKKVIQYSNDSVKLVSFAFKIPQRQPTAEKHGIYLYQY